MHEGNCFKRLFLLAFQGVYIAIVDGGLTNESFQLTAGSLTNQLHGILCENG